MSAASRPQVAPELLAALTSEAPKRLVRKLDKDPQQAAGWAWSWAEGCWRVTSPKGEVVELRELVLSQPAHPIPSTLLDWPLASPAHQNPTFLSSGPGIVWPT